MIFLKRLLSLLAVLCFIFLMCGCQQKNEPADIAATTLPVYTFTAQLCHNTDLTVTQVVNQNVSCLHDYTLQVSQARALEAADAVVVSGAGLDEFVFDIIDKKEKIINASANIDLFCSTSHGDEHSHVHDHDPHIWLSPEKATQMANEICSGLCVRFPEYAESFRENLLFLQSRLDALNTYAQNSLGELRCTKLITFHDGFSYFAEACGLSVLKAIEEESGSETSAKELKELIELVQDENIPAIFVERNGSVAAAEIIAILLQKRL